MRTRINVRYYMRMNMFVMMSVWGYSNALNNVLMISHGKKCARYTLISMRFF